MAIAYIICAAGEGTRTRVINSDIPKPLLLLNGKTLLEHSLLSLRPEKEDLVIIVGQKKDQLSRVDALLKKQTGLRQNQLRWIDLDRLTRGQLETALLAMDQVPEGYGISIFNADSFFECKDLSKFMDQPDWEGLIPCSQEPGESWSFFKTDEHNKPVLKVQAAAEKKRIAPWCSIGFYFFRQRSLFLQMAAAEIKALASGESYVAPLYNRYIAGNHSIGLCQVDRFKAMGTLEQIQQYWGLDLPTMQIQNQENPWKRAT